MAKILGILPNILSLFFASVGMIFFFRGSFCENQFEDAMTLKIVVFTILSLLLCAFVFNARKCNTLLKSACHKHILTKTLVKLLLLGFASMVNFLIKYPRFNFHSSTEDTQRNKLSSRSQFNLYSLGSFSAFAVVLSSKRQESTELGVCDFLLGMTMDASMEIQGNRGPNLWYMLVAYLYCATAIFTKSFIQSLKVNKSISHGTHGNIHDLNMVTVIGGAREEKSIEKTETSDEISNETTPSCSLFTEVSARIPKDISSSMKLVDITNETFGLLKELELCVYKLSACLSKLHFLRGSQGPDFSIDINLKLSYFLRPFGDIPIIGGERPVFETLMKDEGSAGKSNISEHLDGAVEETRVVTMEALWKNDIRHMDGLRRRKSNTFANFTQYVLRMVL